MKSLEGEKLENSVLEEEKKEKKGSNCCGWCYNICVTSIVYYAFFVGGVIGPVTGPTLSEMAAFLNVSETEVSLIFAIKSIGIMIGSLAMGRAVDLALDPNDCLLSHQLHKLFLTAIVFQLIPMIMIPLVPYLWMNLVAHFFIALGWSSMVVTTQMMMKLIYAKKHWGSVLQGMFFNFGFGGLVYPLFIGIIYYFDYEPQVNLMIIYFTAFVVGIPVIPIIFFPPPTIKSSPNFEGEKSDEIGSSEEETSKSELSHVSVSINSSKSSDLNTSSENFDSKKPSELKEESDDEKGTEKSVIQRFLNQVDVLKLSFIILGSINMIFILAIDVTYQAGLFLYCTSLGWSESMSSYMNSIYFCSYSVGRLAGVLESYCLSEVQMLFKNCIGMLASLVVLMIFPTNSVVLILCTISVGFFQATCYGSMFVVGECFNIQISGFGQSIVVGIGAIGFFFTTFTTIIAETYGMYWYVVLNFLYCVILLVFWYIQFMIGMTYAELKKNEGKGRVATFLRRCFFCSTS